MDTLYDPKGLLRPLPVRQYPREMQDFYAGIYEKASRKDGADVMDLMKGAEAVLMPYAKELGCTDPSVFTTISTWGAWHVSGRNSIVVAPLLVRALQNTSLSGIPSSCLRLDPKALWIEAPLVLSEGSSPIEGFYLVSQDMPAYIDPLTEDIDPTKDPTRVIVALAIEKGKDGQAIPSYFFLCRDTVEESIHISSLRAARKTREGSSPIADPAEGVRKILWTFASNLLMYLSSPKADIQDVLPQGLERPPKSRKAQDIHEKIRKREGYGRAIGYRLTRVVRTPRGDSRVLAEDEARNSPQGHMVKGHYKHQPYGPELSLRKYIHIMPYWRGDDGTEELIQQM